MLIKFLKSPVVKANLGYSAGETGDVPNKLATELIEAGYATKATDEPKAKSGAETKAKPAVKAATKVTK